VTNYQRGTRVEYILKAFYEFAGCTVLRAAGSRGPVDLVVFKPDGGVLLIQCKKTASGGTLQFKDDVKKLAAIKTGNGNSIIKWLYVLRTKGKIVDMYMIGDFGILGGMRMDWHGILKVARDGKASR
jgi:Holliday junction resolvase